MGSLVSLQSTAQPESPGLTPAAQGGSGQGGSVLRRSERIAVQDREPPPKSSPFDVACCKPGARTSYEFSSGSEIFDFLSFIIIFI